MLGLPDTSVQVFIKTIVRRESGAAELMHLSSQYTSLQLVVSLVVMTFLVPCLNATLVLYKERGARAAGVIVAAVSVLSIVIGSAVNHLCHWLGITFS
jgi:ferrous iron transport protein B